MQISGFAQFYPFLMLFVRKEIASFFCLYKFGPTTLHFLENYYPWFISISINFVRQQQNLSAILLNSKIYFYLISDRYIKQQIFEQFNFLD